MQPMNNQLQAVSIKFKDGRSLFGVWTLWSRSVSAPLFRELCAAQSHLDCGISRLVDIEKAEKSAEDVEVRLLGDEDSGTLVLTTQASWSEAYITGPCAA